MGLLYKCHPSNFIVDVFILKSVSDSSDSPNNDKLIDTLRYEREFDEWFNRKNEKVTVRCSTVPIFSALSVFMINKKYKSSMILLVLKLAWNCVHTSAQ